MRFGRLTGSLAAALALGMAVSGCGLNGGSGKSTAGGCSAPSGNTGSGALSGNISGSITFQTTSLKKDFRPYFNGVISAFERAHPATTVKWIDDPGDNTFTTRMVADAQACTLPDVLNLNLNTATALTRSGYLLDLDTKAPDAGKPFTDAMWASSAFTDASGKKVHSVLPWYSGATVLTFNKSLLQKAGLSTTSLPATVFGLFQEADRIAKASGGKYYALWANPRLRIPSDWQQMGVQVLSADKKSFTFADDPKTVQWVQWMKKLYQDGAMPRDSLSSDQDPSTAYGQGRLVFGSTTASFLRYVQQNNPGVYKDTGVSSYTLDALGHTVGAPQYITVPATSRNAVTALAFAEFLTHAENQLTWCKTPNIVVFPSTTASLNDPFFTSVSGDDPFAQARRLGAQDRKTATADEIAMSPGELNAIVSAVQPAMQGKEDPATALKNAQSKADELLKQGS